MTWTYDHGGSPRDRLRRLIGDTDTTAQQLQDEELDVYLADWPDDLFQPAIECCLYLQAKYTRQVSKTLGQLSISASDRAKAYGELASQLRARALQAGGLVPFEVGGITRSQQHSVDRNCELVKPPFKRGMYDLPGSSGTSGRDDGRGDDEW